MKKLVKEDLENLKYNELIKIAKSNGVVFNFQKKPELIQLILDNQKIVLPKIAEETKKSPIKYKEPLGTVKSYKDGDYILTEQGWRKQKPA
jgi:hypothetical protein